MAKSQTEDRKEVQIKRPRSIVKELSDLHEAISKRAYEIFENSQGWLGGPLADWFRAERELVWRPEIELRQKDGQLELKAALPGVDPKNIDVQVTPEEILITAAEEHRHEEGDSQIHICEFSGGRLIRSVHLPEAVDPDSAKAEVRNGMLRLTLAVAKKASKKVAIQAA